MSAATPCVPCCSTPQSVNIPGIQGLAGNNGLNGIAAFSITTLDFVVPAPAATVVATVNTTSWMVIGQVVIVGQGVGAGLAGPGPSTFRISSIPSSTTVTLKYLGYAGDIAPGGGNTLSTGCVISPAGDALASPLAVANGGTGAATVAAALTNLGLGYSPITVYGSGAAYTVTAPALAQVTMGTTSPILTLNVAGTYLMLYRCKLDFQSTNFAAAKSFTLQLEKLNNGGPNALTGNSNASLIVPVTTGVVELFSLIVTGATVVYTTAVTTDQVGLYAGLTGAPGAGNVQISECEIVAVKLF